ncbi:MAG: mechanosensitive ion channel family protein [Halodesulfurarchaeum sp.]
MALGIGLEWTTLLRDGGSPESRVLLTVLLLALTVVMLSWGIPLLVRGGFWLLRRGLTSLGLEPLMNKFGRPDSGWGLDNGVIRLLRMGLLGVAALLLLSIWGEIDPVRNAVESLQVPSSVLVKGGLTVLLFVGAYTGMGLLHRWIDRLTARSDRITAHQEEISLRIIQIIFLITASIVVLSVWGIDLGGLLVGAGFLGIVAGLAAQQTLGSLIAGFVLMLSRPFEIGDWVAIGEHEGIVTEVTIVNTRLENFDGEMIVLPNDSVANATIKNRSKKGRLRLRVEVGIDYRADIEEAISVAEEALADVERILTVPRPRVVSRRFGDSAIVLELRFWIDKPSARRRVKATSEAIKAVSSAFDEAGIKIPFPQRELSGRAEEGGFRVVEDGSNPD